MQSLYRVWLIVSDGMNMQMYIAYQNMVNKTSLSRYHVKITPFQQFVPLIYPCQ